MRNDLLNRRMKPAAWTGEPALPKRDPLDLVRLRVAQLMECELGQSHYWNKLRQAGERLSRLVWLEDWPISPLFSARERTALALAELLGRPLSGASTLLPYLLERAQEQLSRAELVQLIIAIQAMHDWEAGKEVQHA